MTANITRAHEPIELVLPWPSRDLHPNSRGHWSKRSTAAKRARYAAWALTRQAYTAEAMASLPEGPLHVWIDGYPTDRRRRDADGLLSSLKPALDGIADALGVDDRRFVPHPWVRDEVRKGGEVRIRITGGPALHLADQEIEAERMEPDANGSRVEVKVASIGPPPFGGAL